MTTSDDDPSSDTGDDGTATSATTSMMSATDGPDPTTTTMPPATDSSSDSGPLVDRCTPPGDSILEVGHGVDEFVPFSEGPADLVYGNQGGIHIDIGLRAEYLDVSGPFLSDIRGYIDGVQVATGQRGSFFNCLPDQSGLVRTGVRLIFELNPVDVHNQTVTVEAEYQDTQGVTVNASGSVLVVDAMQR